MGKLEKLEQLQKLKDTGSLTDEEFKIEKEKLLNKKESNNKKTKVIIAILIIIALLVGGGIGIYYITNNKTAPTTSTTDDKSKEEQGFKQESGNIAVNGTETVSFRNMNVEDEKFNEIQREILNYFDNDYMWFLSEEAQKYPQVFQGAKVETLAVVVKVLKSTNDEFEILALDCDYRGYMGYGAPDIEGIDVNQLRIIKGKQMNERFVNGDKFVFYGKYEDIESRDIDGKNYVIPKLEATNIVKYEYAIEKHSFKTVKNVAEYIFGKDIKISKNNEENEYYKVTLDNQSNSNFKVFNMRNDIGMITYDIEGNDLDSNITKRLFVSADFQHYIVSTHDATTKHVYVEYFGRDLKKIWSREFDYNSSKAFMSPVDYTSDKLAAVIDNDLYLIDLKTGENIIEPVIVGEKVKVNMMADGIILIGDNNKDTIMKVDYAGKILFKINAETKMKQITSATTQIVNGKMVVKLEGDLWSDEYNTDGWGYKYIVLNNDGTLETRTEDLMNYNFIA